MLPLFIVTVPCRRVEIPPPLVAVFSFMLPPFMVMVPSYVENPAAVGCCVPGYAASVHGHGAVVVNPAAVGCGVPGYAASVHGHGAVVGNPAAVWFAVFPVMLPPFMVHGAGA